MTNIILHRVHLSWILAWYATLYPASKSTVVASTFCTILLWNKILNYTSLWDIFWKEQGKRDILIKCTHCRWQLNIFTSITPLKKFRWNMILNNQRHKSTIELWFNIILWLDAVGEYFFPWNIFNKVIAIKLL